MSFLKTQASVQSQKKFPAGRNVPATFSRRRPLRSTILVLLGLFLSTVRLPAQSIFATITGTATDATGAVLPDVTVTATHLATNLKVTAETNAAGIYTLANLKAGDYRLEAHAAGFNNVVLERVSLVTNDIRRLDLAFQPADVRQSVEVTAASAGLIETETGRIGGLRTARDLESLPVNARSTAIVAEYLTAPMVSIPAGSTIPGFAGSGNDQWQYNVDGTSLSGGQAGGAYSSAGNMVAYNDWIGEMKLDVVNNSAEYGQLVQVSIVSKSGTNEFHGDAQDWYSTTAFNSRSFFSPARPTGVSHLLGLSAGGPVYIPKVYNGKNRTFWFISLQDNTGNQKANVINPTVPTQAMRNGTFGVPIRNPFTGEVYSNGQIPASAINPVSARIQDAFYPLPNYGDAKVLQSANYRDTLYTAYDGALMLVSRWDQKLSDKDYLYFSYGLNQVRLQDALGNLPTTGHYDYLRPEKMANLVYTHTFRPTLLNEFRFGYGADTMNYQQAPITGLQQVTALGLMGLASSLPDAGGMLNVKFSNLNVQGLSAVNFHRGGVRVKRTQDQVSYFRGKHSFKFGAEFSRIGQPQISGSTCLFGCVTFANTYSQVPGVPGSGSAYADFLFGVPTSASISYAPLWNDPQRWTQDYYITDTWKVTSRLTLNVGLRYEYAGTWGEANGMLAVFDPASGKIAVPAGSESKISKLMPTSYVPVVTAASVGLPNSLINGDKNNFAPRLGIAYRPFGNQTVFRAGWGIYYNAVPAQPTTAGVPYSLSVPTYTNTAGKPTLVLPQIFPAAGVSGPSTVGLPAAIDPNQKMPYTMQFNVTAEHERWGFGFRASYVGTYTRQMLWSYDLNAPSVDTQLFIQKPRRFGQYPGIDYSVNGASHNYNAMNLGLTRRMKSGIRLDATYTWARDIGDNSGPENPYDRRRERGVNQSVPTHRFSNVAIYEFPFGRGRKFFPRLPRVLDALAGGWNLSAITIFQTGMFLTPTMSIPDPAGIVYTSSGNRPLVTLRPDVLADPNVANPTIQRWFDPKVFTAPPLGRFGNSARGLVFGPGVNVTHAGIQKYIVFSDDQRLPRLRLDLAVLNVFNHPNWANPNTNISSGAAGVITGIGGPNSGSLGDSAQQRTMRGSIRLEW